MGYSMSEATYNKLQKNKAEGRDCRLDRCTRRGTYVYDMGVIEEDERGIRRPEHRTQHTYCGSCAKKVSQGVLYAPDATTVPLPGGGQVVRCEVLVGTGKQITTIYSVRKLARNEVLS